MTAVPSGAVDAAADPAGGLLVEGVLGFLRALEDDGFQVGVRERLDALRLCRDVSLLDRRRLGWSLQSLVAGTPAQWARFDELFRRYWLGEPDRPAAGARPREGRGIVPTPLCGGGARAQVRLVSLAGTGGRRPAEEKAGGGASSQEVLKRTDFRLLNDAEQLRRMEQWVEQLARRMKPRLTRRRRPFRGGGRVHLRRTLRASLSHGGTPLDLVYWRRRRKLPRLILLLDVSRSMRTYSYLFLRFARGIVSVFKDADAFVFHTRLVHVTDALRQRSLQGVNDKLGVMSLGWSGGTRIGECLKSFNDRYGRRLGGSRSIVVILSDGLDSGDTGLLAAELASMKRRSKKLIWLNPLLGREGYQPLAAGMRTALPLVDRFVSAHDFDSLRALESAFAEA